MILKLLNTRSPLIALLLISINIALIYIISAHSVVVSSPTYLLGRLFDSWVDFSHSEWDSLSFSFIFSSMLAIGLSLLNQRFNLIHEAYNLIAFIFIFMLLQNINLFFHPSVILSQLFIFIAFFLLFNLYKTEKNSIKLYQIGLLTGIASLLYLDMLLFIILFPIFFFIIKKSLNFRETGVFLIGFLTIIELSWATYFLISSDFIQPVLQLKNYFAQVNPIIYKSNLKLWVSAFLFFLFLLANWNHFRKIHRLNINIRLYFKSLFASFTLLLLAYFTLKFTSDFLWLSIAFPLSFLYSKFFLSIKQTFLAEILFLLFIGSEILFLTKF